MAFYKYENTELLNIISSNLTIRRDGVTSNIAFELTSNTETRLGMLVDDQFRGFMSNTNGIFFSSNSDIGFRRILGPGDTTITTTAPITAPGDNVQLNYDTGEFTLVGVGSNLLGLATHGITNSKLANSNIIIDGSTLILGSTYSALPLALQNASGLPFTGVTGNINANTQISNSSIFGFKLANGTITNGLLANSNIIIGSVTVPLGSAIYSIPMSNITGTLPASQLPTDFQNISLSQVSVSSGNLVVSNITASGYLAVTGQGANISKLWLGTPSANLSQVAGGWQLAGANLGLTGTSNLNIGGNATIGYHLTASGNISAGGNISSSSNISASGNISSGGWINATGNIYTTANMSAGNIHADTLIDTTTIQATNANITSKLWLGGNPNANLTLTTGNLVVAGSNLNIASGGDLNILSGNLAVGNSISVTNSITAANITASDTVKTASANITGKLWIGGNPNANLALTAGNLILSGANLNIANGGGINLLSGNLVVGNSISAANITASDTVKTASANITGKLWIGGDPNANLALTAGNLVLAGANLNIAGTGNMNLLSGNLAVGNSITATNSITAANITASDTVKTASANITGKLWIGGDPNANLALTAGNLVLAGANLNIANSGNLTVGGSMSVGNGLTVGGSSVISGNLTVLGTMTTINSNVVTVADPVITLGGNVAPVVDDNLDRGIAFRWFDSEISGTAKLGFMGFRDSDRTFRFIPNATDTNQVFTGANGSGAFDAMTLDSNITLYGTGSVVGWGASAAAGGIRLDGANLQVKSNSTGGWYRLFTAQELNNGVALAKSGVDNLTLDVRYDNVSVGINGSGELALKSGGVANSNLVNSNIGICGTNYVLGTQTTNLVLTGANSIVLDTGNINWGAGATVGGIRLDGANLQVKSNSTAGWYRLFTAQELNNGVALAKSGVDNLTLDVRYDNVSVGINGDGELALKSAGVANSNLVNSNIGICGTNYVLGTQTTNLVLTGANSIVLDTGNINWGAGATAGGIRLDGANLQVKSNSTAGWYRLFTAQELNNGAALAKSGTDNLTLDVRYDNVSVGINGSGELALKAAGVAVSNLAEPNIYIGGTTYTLGQQNANLALLGSNAIVFGGQPTNYIRADNTNSGNLLVSAAGNISISAAGGSSAAKGMISMTANAASATDADILFTSKLGGKIGLTMIDGANSVITMGEGTGYGTAGYGFRNNSGAMYYRNSADPDWNKLVSLSQLVAGAGIGFDPITNLVYTLTDNTTIETASIGTSNLCVKDGGITGVKLAAATISNDKLANSAITISGVSYALGSSTANLSITGSNAILFGANANITIPTDGSLTISTAASGNVFIGKNLVAANTFTTGVYSNAAMTNISGTQTLALDFSESSSFLLTLSANADITLANPANANRVGQQGIIYVRTPSTGSGHILRWYKSGTDSAWFFPGGSGGFAPSISVANSVYDVFNYVVISANPTPVVLVTDATGFSRYS